MIATRLAFISAIALLADAAMMAPASADLVRSGPIQLDTSEISATPGSPVVPITLAEILQNQGFETVLPPWTTNGPWTVVTNSPHSGQYTAYDVGDFYVQQTFPAVPTGGITSASFWAKQPEAGIQLQSYELFYSDNVNGETFFWFPGDDWTFRNITGELRANANLTRIRIWGYDGGGPGLDESFVDDISIQTAPTVVTHTTWGAIKTTFK